MQSTVYLFQSTAHRGQEATHPVPGHWPLHPQPGHAAHQRALLLLEVIPKECRTFAAFSKINRLKSRSPVRISGEQARTGAGSSSRRLAALTGRCSRAKADLPSAAHYPTTALDGPKAGAGQLCPPHQQNPSPGLRLETR